MDAAQLREAGISPLAVKLLADSYKKQSPGRPLLFEHGDVSFALHAAAVDAGEGILYLSRTGDTMECEVHLADQMDPAFWGMVLADVVRHIARAMKHAAVAEDEEDAVNSITAWLLREIDSPTGESHGGLET